MWKIEDADELYGIELWGNGYFSINRLGHLTVRPLRSHQEVDLCEVMAHIKKRKIRTPVLLRFPQILEDRVAYINTCFSNSISEFQYDGRYHLAFPFKVNQRREVIETILRAGRKYNVGLEVGSKAEMLAALTLSQNREQLLICNGFKDEEYLRMAFYAAAVGKNVVIVIDEVSEAHRIVKLNEEMGFCPTLGLRIKLYMRGSGKWADTGGEYAKFGLSAPEILACINTLKTHNLLSKLKFLHFHIGSQITEIKRIQEAVREAARMYAKLIKIGVSIQFFDVGGGLGVDYDGSRTSSEASMNYTEQEYANNVVYTLKDICDLEDVPYPTIISESGRAVTAYHALLITDVLGSVPGELSPTDFPLNGEEPHVISELRDCLQDINVKNYVEYYHDALQQKDEMITLFRLGQITLEDRAKGEVLFREICRKVLRFAKANEDTSEEFEVLFKLLSQKYITNFSIFQSTPDVWGIRQLFPIVPIQNLNKVPERHCTIADVTCDSHGVINKFIDLKDIKEVLELHKIEDDGAYYIAVLLIGAYQETIGDIHNLFGTTNEVVIIVDDKGEWHITKTIRGDTLADVLSMMRYPQGEIADSLASCISGAVQSGLLREDMAEKMRTDLMQMLESYTYLSPKEE